jgi:hypothetical protein
MENEMVYDPLSRYLIISIYDVENIYKYISYDTFVNVCIKIYIFYSLYNYFVRSVFEDWPSITVNQTIVLLFFFWIIKNICE